MQAMHRGLDRFMLEAAVTHLVAVKRDDSSYTLVSALAIALQPTYLDLKKK